MISFVQMSMVAAQTTTTAKTSSNSTQKRWAFFECGKLTSVAYSHHKQDEKEKKILYANCGNYSVGASTRRLGGGGGGCCQLLVLTVLCLLNRDWMLEISCFALLCIVQITTFFSKWLHHGKSSRSRTFQAV